MSSRKAEESVAWQHLKQMDAKDTMPLAEELNAWLTLLAIGEGLNWNMHNLIGLAILSRVGEQIILTLSCPLARFEFIQILSRITNKRA